MSGARVCEECLRRSWLIARLAPHLELVRSRIDAALALDDDDLIEAVGGERREVIRDELGRLDVGAERARTAGAGVEAICRCDPCYPARLTALASPPAVIHVAGELERFLDLAGREPVAIVGARRASDYGLAVARSLGRGLAAAGITVVSGMALGVDSAAHLGALAAPGATVAVLPGGAERAYPASGRALHRQIRHAGAAVSELPPGAGAWRWSFPARNRIIAGLCAMTVVVEAAERSGALLTAAMATEIGRPLGAVPGRVTAPLAAGPNRLLASGAQLVRGAEDVLDALFGADAPRAPLDDRPQLAPDLQRLLAAIGDGLDTSAALVRAGFGAEQALGALASLELAGYVRREPGGRFSVVP